MSPVSFNPKTFVEGGLIDDVDVEFVEVQFCQYDYNGASDPVLALGVKMRAEQDGQLKDFDQYYSAGSLEHFVPSADGYGLEPVGGKTSLNSNTNTAKFFQSLLEASNGGLEEVLNSGNVAGLVGLKCHVARVAQPKRSGIIRTGKNADREATVLLVNRIIAYPGQAVPATPAKPPSVAKPSPAPVAAKVGIGGGTKHTVAPAKIGMGTAARPAATPSPVASAAPPSNGAANGSAEVDELAGATLLEILSMAGGTLAKKDIPPKSFQSDTLKGNPLKAKVVTRIFSDDFLSSAPGITYDGANVSLA
jgi:hypothetical protein